MSTVATPEMQAFMAGWKKLFDSAVISGIVGDARHAATGGYHISREDQPATNYSVVRPDDKPGNGPDNAASAGDMSMSEADMITCTKRLIVGYENPADPRRKYLNAFNGWLGGSAHAQRWDVYAHRTEAASSDHEWHVHLSVRRKYVQSQTALNAILSLLAGQALSDYLTSIGVRPPAPAVAVPRYPGYALMPSPKVDVNMRTWQRRMLARGWMSLGVADGIFGPRSLSVVRRWQTLCGVPSDGVIGRVTWPTPWTRPVAR